MTVIDERVDPTVELPPDVSDPDRAGGLLPGDVLAVACRFCPAEFGIGQGSILARGRHEKKEHREQWESARTENARRKSAAGAKKPGRPAAKKAAPAPGQSSKKAPGTPRTSATPSARGGAPRRQSAAELLSMGAQVLSWGLTTQETRNPAAGPMARMIGFESPILGAEADAALAGTTIDRVLLQRAVSGKDRFERLGPLLLAPMMVGVAALQPAAWPEIYPMLRACLSPMLPALVEEMRRQAKAAEQMRAMASELADLDPGFAQLFASGRDPIDAIIDAIFPRPGGFAGPPEPTPAGPAPDA